MVNKERIEKLYKLFKPELKKEGNELTAFQNMLTTFEVQTGQAPLYILNFNINSLIHYFVLHVFYVMCNFYN